MRGGWNVNSAHAWFEKRAFYARVRDAFGSAHARAVSVV